MSKMQCMLETQLKLKICATSSCHNLMDKEKHEELWPRKEGL